MICFVLDNIYMHSLISINWEYLLLLIPELWKVLLLQGESGVTQMFSCMRRQVTSPFNTIIHGEFWEKNILFRNDEESLQCVILDWKNAKIASATKDIAFFLLSSTTNKLRTENLDMILRSYFSSFCEAMQVLQPDLLQDPSLTFDHFFEDYKISTKGAFMQSVCVLIQEMQHLESQLGSDNEKQWSTWDQAFNKGTIDYTRNNS